MDIINRFIAIKDFLKPYQGFYFDEILNKYPHTMDAYPEEWLNMLEGLSLEELWKIDAKTDFSPIFGDFKKFVDKIQTLSEIPREIEEKVLPKIAYLGMTPKKIHEVSRLGPYIEKLQKKHSFKNAVDIGGGKGHLSRTLAYYFNLETECLDPDLLLLEAGKKLLIKHPVPVSAKSISFTNKSLGNYILNENVKAETMKENFDEKTLTLGLHTCGPLALRVMDQSQNLVNFGCCYIKLCPDTEVNISNVAKKDPLPFSKYSLTLSSRTHGDFSFEDFLNKWKVKNFRYSLALLFYHHLGITDFMEVKSYPLKKYGQDFSAYALEKLNELNISHDFDADFLNSFYKEHKGLVKKMILANIIRWQTGRLLEIYILFDRAIYLQEKGFNVEIAEFFNAGVSPRNIGITALKM